MTTTERNPRPEWARAVASLVVATALLVPGSTMSQAQGETSTRERLAGSVAEPEPAIWDGEANLAVGGWWAPATSGASRPTTIAIRERGFIPSELVVPVGTTVSWRNLGREQHTTTSPGVWDSGPLRGQQGWSAIFAVPGRFDYLCLLHPSEMSGRIVVTSSSAPALSPTAPAAATSPPVPTLSPAAADAPSLGIASELPPSPAAGSPATPGVSPASPGGVQPGPALPPALATGSRCPAGSRCAPEELTGLPGDLPVAIDTGSTRLAAATSLSPLRQSGVSGEAALLRSGDDTVVTVSLRGLTPSTPYTGHVRAAGCDGPILFALGMMVADGSGQGYSSTALSAPADPSEWWISYHAGAGSAGAAITCGPLGRSGYTPAGTGRP
jgi:plastocyanin